MADEYNDGVEAEDALLRATQEAVEARFQAVAQGFGGSGSRSLLEDGERAMRATISGYVPDRCTEEMVQISEGVALSTLAYLAEDPEAQGKDAGFIVRTVTGRVLQAIAFGVQLERERIKLVAVGEDYAV